MRCLDGKTVLITGGAGFIGSHLADRLISQYNCEIIVIDNLFVGSEENLAQAVGNGALLYRDDAEFYSSLDYIFSSHAIDIVFNCATKALNYSFVNPSNAFDTNVKVVLNLLELQRKGRFSTLCHFSTSEVYGTAVYEPMDEDHPKNPTTTYAAGKAAADLAVESYVRMFDVDAFIVRPFNNYGPRQNYQGPLAGVIPLTVARILQGQVPEIHGTGQQSRDFIFVQDTVDAVLSVFRVLPAGECVNVSSDNVITIADLITTIAEEMECGQKIKYREGRKSDVFCHVASNEKIKSLIDYSLMPFAEGLSMTIDWYVQQLARISR